MNSLANTKSAAKRAEAARKRAIRNKAIKSRVKTAIKKFQAELAGNSLEAARGRLTEAVRIIDKAVTKGVLHKNTAARKKSRLYKQFNLRAG